MSISICMLCACVCTAYLHHVQCFQRRYWSHGQPPQRGESSAVTYRVALENWHIFLVRLNFIKYWPILKLISQTESEEICNTTITKYPNAPQVCRYTTLWNVSVCQNKTTSVTTHFKSASFSNKAGTLNIWCKSCRMWQLLQTITETIKSLFPVVNFFKICCCWSLVFICWVTGYQNRLYPN